MNQRRWSSRCSWGGLVSIALVVIFLSSATSLLSVHFAVKFHGRKSHERGGPESRAFEEPSAKCDKPSKKNGGGGGDGAKKAAAATARFATVDMMVAEDIPLDDATWLPNPPAWILGNLQTANRPTLSIALISNNRTASLKRLCNSLLRADYSGAGAFFTGGVDLIFNLEATSTHRLKRYALEFEWPHGRKLVRRRVLQGGLVRAVTESWFPSSLSDFGLLLEDDIEVSRHYLTWINKVMLANTGAQFDPRLVGISLYSPRLTETTNPRRAFRPNEMAHALSGERESPYLMQTPCSWGAVYFPTAWADFLGYMQKRLEFSTFDASTAGGSSTSSSSKGGGAALQRPEWVTVPGSRTNGWTASWKKYMCELMWLEGTYMMYPNFERQESLSTNHMEKGEHILDEEGPTVHKRNDFIVPLLVDGSKVRELAMAPLRELPKLDLFGDPWLGEREMRESLARTKIGWDRGNLTDLWHAPKYVVDVLQEGEVMESGVERILISRANPQPEASMFIYHVVLQPDGQFVIYRTDRRDPASGATPVVGVWDAGTFQGLDPCCRYVAGFGARGSFHVVQINAPMGNATRLLFASPEDPKYDPANKYHLRVESSGTLVVYRGGNTCEKSSVVWQSENRLPVPSVPKWPPSRCGTTGHRQELCSNFPVVMNRLLKATGVTLLISTHHRFELLAHQLSYYAASPDVVSIVVTWHNAAVAPPDNGAIHGTTIRFVRPELDSLNSRFEPLEFVNTECVMILDDDMKLHLQDLHHMYVAWEGSGKRQIVGAAPRWIKFSKGSPEGGEPEYLFQSEDPPYKGGKADPKAKPRAGYSLMLTKAMMIHRDYLRLYTCGGRAGFDPEVHVPKAFTAMRQAILETVDEKFNCEDIGMNFVVAAALYKRQKARNADKSQGSRGGGDGGDGEAAPALFVPPMHPIGDFGKMGKSGLHLRQSHANVRDQCLKKFNAEFRRVTGTSLPTQTRVARPKPFKGGGSSGALAAVHLVLGQYRGHRQRAHVDCAAVGEGEACSWALPPRLDFEATWAKVEE